jgi:hypothetical protein
MEHLQTNYSTLLGLWNHNCGSSQHLWHGSTLEQAAVAWRTLVAGGEEAHLTAWQCGTIATHEEMRWKFGEPKGTFACPICGRNTPHPHSAEAMEFYWNNEHHRQRTMVRRWEEILARVASITGTEATQTFRIL